MRCACTENVKCETVVSFRINPQYVVVFAGFYPSLSYFVEVSPSLCLFALVCRRLHSRRGDFPGLSRFFLVPRKGSNRERLTNLTQTDRWKKHGDIGIPNCNLVLVLYRSQVSEICWSI